MRSLKLPSGDTSNSCLPHNMVQLIGAKSSIYNKAGERFKKLQESLPRDDPYINTFRFEYSFKLVGFHCDAAQK